MAIHERPSLSREERRNLDIEIGFLAGLIHRDPGYVDALQVLAEDYTRRGKLTDGLKVDEQLARLLPADPRVLYNLACSYALTDKPEAAFDTLNQAIDKGFRDFRWLGRDPDLAQFRRHPLYRKIRTRVKSMQVEVR